ncbi:winged helix-turn-helix domain-containing protein [Candidatus Enterococcus ferrettii]|uniref:OmpR/PhoB-type domain-containing protein n=1 Tax=Candidatus Enterococcus ferrettii TaxID=2815324 RepID=A0ABV0EVV3_9ENTE|nr:helix-turn-helix domain-containing protein [Enterococcus sp. 665A]MBO1342256.1 winged helix-turn-helix domain-containing protein [Enterococcus sp. 665A]
MNKVLLLTKNILAEQQLQKQLQLLNYEVFCSSEGVKNAQMFAVFQFFPIIMLSETISNLEAKKLLAAIGEGKNLVIRLTSESEPNEEEREAGISGYLSKILPFDSMREKLVLLQGIFYEERIESESRECPPIQNMENRSLQTSAGRIFFSKKEERLFKLLLEAQGRMLSRKEICDILWSEGETDSNRSQLSCIATKIKSKFKNIGYQGDTIITKWGQGYALAPSFYTYLTTGQLDTEYLRESNQMSSVTV